MVISKLANPSADAWVHRFPTNEQILKNRQSSIGALEPSDHSLALHASSEPDCEAEDRHCYLLLLLLLVADSAALEASALDAARAATSAK